MSGNEIKNLREEAVMALFKEEHLVIAGKTNIATMIFLKKRIREIEKAVLKMAKLSESTHRFELVPGINIGKERS
jgi:predicted class III extradiol MEMO1 family dioxygenase